MNVFTKLLVGGSVLLLTSAANAQNVHGVLRVVKGDVQIKSAKSGQTVKARIGEQVFPKDTVITGKDSRAKIVMVDNNEINVSPDSQIEIQHYEFDPAAGKKDVLLNVIYGKVRSKVEQKYDGKSSKFQVKTPSAVAGVRGTDFMTSYNKTDNSSQVVTFRGAVEFGLPGANGSITNGVSVTPGKTASNVGGVPPGAPINMPKEQLAKMDNDTKADTGGAKGDGKGDRAPSNDGKGDGDKDKKDGDKKSDDGKKPDDAKKDDGKKTDAAKSDSGKGAGGGGSATAGGSTTGGANDSGGGTATRQPSSDSGPKVGSAPGGSMISSNDMPGSAPPPPPPVMPPPPPPMIPTINPVGAIPTCSICNQLIQNGNTKLVIHVK